TGGGAPLQLGLGQTLGAIFTDLPPTPSDDPRVAADLENRMGIRRGTSFHKGDEVLNMKIMSGDHLFIDRVSYNFRPPDRGDIVVFETRGIDRLPVDQQDTFYIKRLVGLGGDTLSLKEDFEVEGIPEAPPGLRVTFGHLVVNGKSLSAATPGFENLYSFSDPPAGAKVLQYQRDHYYGHALLAGLGRGQEFQVCSNCFFVMG